jgi:hypothetical protein
MRQYLFCFYNLFLCFCLNTVLSFAQDQSNTNWQSGYDVKWYKVDIHANDTIAYVWGNTTILSEIKEAFTDTFCFELANTVSIDSIKIFGKLNNYSRKGDLIEVPLAHHLSTNQLLTVEIFHRGGNTGSVFFSSFSNKKDTEWDIPVTWTLSEPFGAKTWFPCKQSLTDKADSATVMITVPRHLKAGSNGKLEAVVPVDSASCKYIWKTKYPVAYYLLSFTVANYNDYSFYAPTSSTDSVLVQNFYYNRPGFFESNKANMDATAKFIRLFSDLFGEYPFKKEKYGHCLAPMGGGMEHQTMTTLSSFGYDLISHELAHQWFGDLVTCSDWQNIWINEGFASYAEYLAIQYLKSEDQATDWMKNAFDYTFYYSKGSVFVPKQYINDESRIFDYGLTYKKGASIIQALRNEIHNDTVFFGVLREFLSTYAFKNADTRDFITVLNKKTGADYHWFFDQWYYGKGFPELNLFWQSKNDSVKIYAIQKHSANGTNPFKMHYDIKIGFAGSDTTIRVFQDKWAQFYSLPCKGKIDLIEGNPNYKSYMKLAGVYETVDLPTIDEAFSVVRTDFTDSLKIQIITKVGKSAKIIITDLKGTPILEKKIRNQKSVALDTQLFEKGYYLLYFMVGTDKYVRIIKKK